MGVCLGSTLYYTTSFCNYKLGCTHTHHQVGPWLKAQATRSHHPATLNLSLCESYRLLFFFNAHLRSHSLQANQPVGIKTLNFILKHQEANSSYRCTIWELLSTPPPPPNTQYSGKRNLAGEEHVVM